MLVHTRAEFVKHTKRSRREFFFSKSNEFNDFFFILRYSFKFGCVYCVAVLLVRTTNEYLF